MPWLLRLEVSGPIPSAASSTITSRPATASARATARPTTPAPITMQSIRSMGLSRRAGSVAARPARGQAARGFARRAWVAIVGAAAIDRIRSMDQAPRNPDAKGDQAHVIVLGNEKGGSGKSTTAMHLIVGLLHEERRVGCIDLDLRQGTLSPYLANRVDFCQRRRVRPLMPHQIKIDQPDQIVLDAAIADLKRRCDVVVIDCPGHDAPLSRRAHAMADTLITPLNDSFIDFDVLAHVDPDSIKVVKPSHYAEMVRD